jgi:superfamily II DNA or RNA helicase/HKD family nuclease
MEIGLYEQIVNKLFEVKLRQLDSKQYYIGRKPIDASNVAGYLSRYLCGLLEHVFSQFNQDSEDVEKAIGLANNIIKSLARDFYLEDNDLVSAKAEILTAVIDKTKFDYPDIASRLQEITPLTSLVSSALFTGSSKHVTMESELRREIQSSDEICLLVSFIKRTGLNLIFPQLEAFTKSGKQLRIITTTYMGATDYNAVKKLASLDNCEIKISYNSEIDRLHAKSYLFLRNTGFHTAYIGSSNLSGAALTEGLEWNVKVTQAELPHIIKEVRHTFDSYWADPLFETFVSGRDDERLKEALAGTKEGNAIDYSVLDLMRAHDYQDAVLEKLRLEREVFGHYRNLVVAATGTGKTVIAAFDYKNFREQNKRANFLFIAHREEILKQSCRTFRTVLQDENFGDLWYGGVEPKSLQHLFASKDMLNNRLDNLDIAEDFYDYIIFDEVHHIAADSYRKILARFKPKILLGLTATPERMDGEDITLDFDGKISAEIRLDDALNNNLLAPFHYYGITDSVDLRKVKWNRGKYDISELSKVYTYNDQRTGLILNRIDEYLPDYSEVRALCFCVDIEHAKNMAAKFQLAGLKSGYLVSDNGAERNLWNKRLKEKKINFLFVVDMFNEGVDIPEVDTILFLRPTESLTVFLQQFGRGLRKCEGKDYVTILDFVGQCNKEFNYVDRFRRLIGRTSMSVEEEMERDFPHLPLGCHITLEPKAKEYILENIRASISSFRKVRIVNWLRTFHNDCDKPLNLTNFLNLHQIPLEKFYKSFTWGSLLFDGGIVARVSRFEVELKRAVYKKWLSTDSYSYFSFIEGLAEKRMNVDTKSFDERERQMALMFYYDLFLNAGRYSSLQAMFNDLASDELFCDEIKEVATLLKNRCEAYERPDNSGLLDFPLKLHGVYTKDQIFVAIGTSTLDKKSSNREGVERNKKLGIEAMYVDIIKDREEGSNTNYNDFAINESLFNWETQNSVSSESQAGQNYIKETQKMLLFVRQQNTFPEDKGRTMGFTYLGEVVLEKWRGARPMEIVWRLKTPMPASFFKIAKHRAVG